MHLHFLNTQFTLLYQKVKTFCIVTKYNIITSKYRQMKDQPSTIICYKNGFCYNIVPVTLQDNKENIDKKVKI